jgi:hypothetical protein
MTFILLRSKKIQKYVKQGDALLLTKPWMNQNIIVSLNVNSEHYKCIIPMFSIANIDITIYVPLKKKTEFFKILTRSTATNGLIRPTLNTSIILRSDVCSRSEKKMHLLKSKL